MALTVAELRQAVSKHLAKAGVGLNVSSIKLDPLTGESTGYVFTTNGNEPKYMQCYVEAEATPDNKERFPENKPDLSGERPMDEVKEAALARLGCSQGHGTGINGALHADRLLRQTVDAHLAEFVERFGLPPDFSAQKAMDEWTNDNVGIKVWKLLPDGATARRVSEGRKLRRYWQLSTIKAALTAAGVDHVVVIVVNAGRLNAADKAFYQLPLVDQTDGEYGRLRDAGYGGTEFQPDPSALQMSTAVYRLDKDDPDAVTTVETFVQHPQALSGRKKSVIQRGLWEFFISVATRPPSQVPVPDVVYNCEQFNLKRDPPGPPASLQMTANQIKTCWILVLLRLDYKKHAAAANGGKKLYVRKATQLWRAKQTAEFKRLYKDEARPGDVTEEERRYMQDALGLAEVKLATHEKRLEVVKAKLELAEKQLEVMKTFTLQLQSIGVGGSGGSAAMAAQATAIGAVTPPSSSAPAHLHSFLSPVRAANLASLAEVTGFRIKNTDYKIAGGTKVVSFPCDAPGGLAKDRARAREHAKTAEEVPVGHFRFYAGYKRVLAAFAIDEHTPLVILEVTFGPNGGVAIGGVAIGA